MEDKSTTSILFEDFEPFSDLNENNTWDAAEPFTDKGNGIYDVGEKFIDINSNNTRDLSLWYVDANRNGKWDTGDPFQDLNQNGRKDFKEKYTDKNNNNKFDPPEKTDSYKFSFNALEFSEPYTDATNGRYDQGEKYEDLNDDGKWTSAEEFEDLNGDGIWSPIEKAAEIVIDQEEAIEESAVKPIVERAEPKDVKLEDEAIKVDEPVTIKEIEAKESKSEIEIFEENMFELKDRASIIYEDVTDQWIPSKYYPLLPQLLNPFPVKVKTLILKSSNPYWNGHFLKPFKKLRKIKQEDKSGLNPNTIVQYNRWEDDKRGDKIDLQIPAVVNINWYKKRAFKENIKEEFREIFIKKITKKTQGTSGRGKGFSIINAQIGETDVELNVGGNISVNGALVFENKDLITTNLKESKSWDLEIEQTQRFNIDGNIGDRFFVKIKQDSEADFTWENDLTIEYKGNKNDILQKAEAGNINLSLEGMDAVTMGGSNSSLFGIKAVSQLGPIEIQSVIAREQVKKSEKTYEGGAESGGSTSIKDYNFIRDRYFFINETFKNNFYPLNESNQNVYDPNYVVGEFELYQKVINEYEAGIIQANAYLDPLDTTSYSLGGNWLKLEEDIDYTIDRLHGYVRIKSAQNAIAIYYITTTYDNTNQTFGTIPNSPNGTNSNLLKLLKDIEASTPNSPTWPLMFKNVYSIGGSNIDPSGLEINILLDEGAGNELTHSESGNSYLSIFGLDSEDELHKEVEGGDGKIDLYGSFLNLAYGELICPSYLPFAYNILGSQHIDLNGVIPELNQAINEPAMYYNTNSDEINSQHKFIIKVKTSSLSTSMSLGFMIVEGSETVRLGSEILNKDVDYTIDYFSGTINFISQSALDPTAAISVSYEENEFISFDQKLLVGTHLKYDIGEKNYLAGGMFYYNQSIAEEKVDIGYEPMQNFVWNIKGKYQNELGLLTRAVDYLPLIETTKPSIFKIEGNYAEINPNPNPLGQAFIDDFESAKRTSSLSIMQRQWKMASPPLDSMQTINNRGKMIWYNPYEDELTKNIWPEQSTSTRANNNTTKTMYLQTDFQRDPDDLSYWNGIMIPLYSSEHDQSLSKYMDIWLNADGIQDDSPIDSFKVHIDIGHISEDWNNNGILDTEDEPVYGPGMGDGILSDGEDIGVDNCTNSYENGWGGCLCAKYDEAIYDSDLDAIKITENPSNKDRTGATLIEFCLDQNAVKYNNAKDIALDYPDSISVNINADFLDPNGDNWCYNTSGCTDTDTYSQTNGTEGNGDLMGGRYPDTEDLDKNNTLDTQNDYFTFTLYPKLPTDHPESMVVTESMDENIPTGWKLIRISLASFKIIGQPEWSDVPTFRIRLETAETTSQILKIAKIELVENDWQEMGTIAKQFLSDKNSINEDPFFSVSVINTDESTEYKNSLDDLDIILEHDEYNDIDMKEQSLVLSFEQNPDYDNNNDPENFQGGIVGEHAVLITNTFSSLGDKAQSYFAYEKMKMFVHGGDPVSPQACSWCSSDSSEVDLLFRIGKDDKNYYEFHQPIYKGWNDKNHIDINIDKLTQLKIPTIESPVEELNDVGLDGYSNNNESGCIDDIDYSLGYNNQYIYKNILEAEGVTTDSSFWVIIHRPNDDEAIPICGQLWWNEKECTICSADDPNGDDFQEKDNPEGTEDNNKYDQFDNNNDGLISFGEAEPAIDDFDGDGIYTPHPTYNYENKYYYWDEASVISDACGYCTKLQIKGAPSINNIQTIVMGVINNSHERIYGKVLVNELRMTGVKKRKGRSYSISGSLDFADLMSISGSYNKKDSDFHKLQQRLGTGNSDVSYSSTIKLHPNIILPTRWGIKTPITLGYSNSIATPKYHPGSDILTDPENENFEIKEIQTITEKLSFSTSFSKSTRSTNWFLKRTLDNVSLSFSAIRNNKSTNQVFYETKNNYENSGSYSYTFGKENYISPFTFTKDWFLIGSILGEARYYYTPDKINANINFSENSSWKIQRVNLKTVTTDDDTTKSYSFNMGRKFTLNHKFTKTLTSNYTKQIDSNLDKFRYNKWEMVEQMNHGLVKMISEKLTNTYSPDFMKWLNPTITYNPNYNWNLNIIDTVTTASIKSSNSFKTKIGFSFKELIELVYTPDNTKQSSSRGRGRGRSSSSRSSINTKKINIKNPVVRFILGKFYFLASKLNTINSTYTYTTSHDYNNINSNQKISYLYRLGLQESPLDTGSVSLYDDDINTANNLVGSQSSSYGNDLTISSSISLTRSIVTSLDFKYSNSLSIPSIASRTKSESFSFYPLGTRGDEGFPITNWSVNWSGIEKWWFMDKFFKSINLSHGFNGEHSLTSKDENNDGKISDDELQNEQYSFNYSPIIGTTIKTIGRSPITFKVNFNYNQNIKKIDESTERNHSSQITGSISYKKSGGLTIPTFFFRDFYIDNDIDFAFNFNWDTDQKLMTSAIVDELSDFNEQSKNTSWALKPNITYSFTRWVNGNFYFIYGITENKTTGRNEEKDFGFSMNIKIQG